MLRMTWLRAVAALVLVAGVAVVVALNDDNDSAVSPGRAAAVRATGEVVDAPGCGINTSGAWTGVPSRRDVQVGPLIFRGGNQWARGRRDAFGGHGYKIPALLPNGHVVTLAVHESLRGRVGLVYSAAAQEQQRVGPGGVAASDESVRFTACPAEQPGRTGWTGGIVLDRPRCVTLVLKIDGGAPMRGRVPLGQVCHAL